ncbi:hypothetical protein [Leptothrix discophora]|uniref:Uncharacterized protein n=1 Tax=Leptothrix discophora TaxID=89 RepID=A0ABT9G246_LEPDI|nr:hypothetical protein [Leptothrix discophora]MDP4300347.1 hypothetical protein [Leptothrix discophora]
MKVLITADTFAPSMDGPVHLAAHTIAEMEADSARSIVNAAKGLYVDGKDDPGKTKQHTASAELIRLVREAQAEARREARKVPAGTSEPVT